MNSKTKAAGIITVLGLIVVLIAVALTPIQVGATGGVESVIDYDHPSLPEGIAIDKTGNIYVSLANQSHIRKIAPDGTDTLLATLPAGGFGLLGLAVDAPGNVYAALATADGVTNGVYRVSRDGTSEPQQLPGSEAIFVPNALVFDKQGNLYVTDTVRGAVWLIPRGGEAELWLEDDLLVGTGVLGFGVPVGANGIAYRKGTLYVANSEKGHIVSIPVNKDGSPGDAQVLVTGLFGVDGLALDLNGNIYAASVTDNLLIRVNLADASKTVLASQGLDGPASLAFGTGQGDRKFLFLTNFALLSDPQEANPGVVKIDVGVPGLPLP